MKTITLGQARRRLTELVGALQEGPVLLLRNGRPCAALVGLNDRFDRESFSLGRNQRLRRLMDDACRRTKKTGGVSFSAILDEVRRAPARKRAPRRDSQTK